MELPAWLEWTWLITLALAAAEVAGIALAVDAIMRNRTPQGTVAWVVSLVLLPVAAIPFYLVFGNRRFNGYVRALRRGHAKMRSLWERASRAVEPFAVRADAVDPRADLTKALGCLVPLPETGGNDVHLLIDGEATFDSIIAGIGAARNYVLVQFYIVRDDGLGRRFAEALIAARERGVAVFFLYDEHGSSVTDGYLERLTSAGCEVSGFRTTSRGNRFQIQMRNHRKIVVVDGQRSWVGGHNVGDEYLGLDPTLGSFRDTHLVMDGPCTAAVQLAWCEDWHWATGRIPDLAWTPRAAGEVPVLVVPSGPADDFETCSLMFLHLITGARRRLWISTPYFVPDEGIIAALQLAAKRGVDVRVMIPDKNDNQLVRWSMLSYYPDMIPAGVKLYRYTKGFLHHKVLLADDAAAVGTANFDNRSFRINFEITVLAEGPEIGGEMASMLRRDFERCHGARLADFESRRWWHRALARAARLTSPIQ